MNHFGQIDRKVVDYLWTNCGSAVSKSAEPAPRAGLQKIIYKHNILR